MRRGAILLGLTLAGLARGQDTPPLVLPQVADQSPVPNGTPVSRPLTPTVNPPTEVPPPATDAPPPLPEETTGITPARPLGQSWGSYELLFWWTKAAPVPPLVTASRPGTVPTLGTPGTALLVGGQALDTQDTAGMRLTTGWATESRNAGLEISYFFLGTRTYTDLVTDNGARAVARPIIDADRGGESAVFVAQPGVGSGLVEVTSSSRATGWEVLGVGNLYANCGARLNVSAGYRYFQFNDGLRVEQTSLLFPLPDRPQILAGIADQIDAHNRFHGGQVRLHAEFSRGPVYVELAGSVALGRTVQVVKTSGQAVVLTAGTPISLMVPVQSGVLVTPPTAGRRASSAFAVLPEGKLKVGCKLGDNSLFYVGYDFLYLSAAVRPGDQIDRTVSPAQVALSATPANAFVPQTTGMPRRVETDLWLQGLLFGLEYRY